VTAGAMCSAVCCLFYSLPVSCYRENSLYKIVQYLQRGVSLNGPLNRRVRDAIQLTTDRAADVEHAGGRSEPDLVGFMSQPPAVRRAMALRWSSEDVDDFIEGVCDVRIPHIIGRMDGRQFMSDVDFGAWGLVSPLTRSDAEHTTTYHDGTAKCILSHMRMYSLRACPACFAHVSRNLLTYCSRWIQSPEPMLGASVSFSDIKLRMENGIQRMIQKRRSAPRAPISTAAAGGSSPAAAAAASSASPAASSVSYVDRVRMWTREQVREFFTHLELPNAAERLHFAGVDGAKLLTLTQAEFEVIMGLSVTLMLFTSARAAFMSTESRRLAHVEDVAWACGRVCACVCASSRVHDSGLWRLILYLLGEADGSTSYFSAHVPEAMAKMAVVTPPAAASSAAAPFEVSSYPESQFVDKVDPRFICTICTEVAFEPPNLKCGQSSSNSARNTQLDARAKVNHQ
jgi:hypothetical protein